MGFLFAIGRVVFAILGLLALAMGLLWIGQGTGYVMWPQTSFMLQQTIWAWYGACLAVGGLILMTIALRTGRRHRYR